MKDLLSAVLAVRWPTAASAGFNELGVPLTLAGAPDGTRALVVEMGARAVGDVAALCALARPAVGVVTRVAAVHTATFGSLEDVARAKGELVEALPPDGTAVLNAADPRVAAMAGRTRARTLTYADGGDVQAEDVRLDADLRPSFALVTPWGRAEVQLAVRGAHMVDNALAAAAAALVCGVALDEVAAGLDRAGLSRWRMELATLPSGARVLNDAYNANPTSMAAALRALAALDAERRIAVLGVMAEIGPSSDEEHRTSASWPESWASRSSPWACPPTGPPGGRRRGRRGARPGAGRRRAPQGRPMQGWSGSSSWSAGGAAAVAGVRTRRCGPRSRSPGHQLHGDGGLQQSHDPGQQVDAVGLRPARATAHRIDR